MSRMGKQPIDLVDGVTVDVVDRSVTVTGPKGTLAYDLPDNVTLEQRDGRLRIAAQGGPSMGSEAVRQLKATHGLVRSLLQGMVTGVSVAFTKQLELQGVGYRAQVSGQHLTIALGYSHPVEYDVPEDVSISVPDPTHIVLESIDKQSVGQAAATIRKFRPPDAYKGKGIRYQGEQVTLKEGKTVA